MMDNLYQIFGSQPSYIAGLLGEDEAERLRKQAQQSAMMNFGLSLLAASGPSTTQRSTGQLLAQGIMAGQQASRNAYEQAVRDRMMQEQIAEQRRVRAEQAETLRQQQVAQQMAQGLFVSPAAQLAQGLQRTGAEVTAAMPEASAMDVRMMRQPVPAAQTTGIDMDTLRNILINAPRGAAPYVQTVQEIQKLTPRPKLTEFDPLKELRDEEGRIVRPAGQKQDKETTDIRNYQQAVEQGYKGSFIDYQQLTGPKTQTTINMPSEGERKAAVLSSRLNFSVGEMNRAIGKDPNAAAPNTIAEAAKFLTRSDFISNKLTPTQRQIVEAAQLDVLDAALTLGTGAAYTVQQLESYRKAYFPQLNEDKATIESKQRRLENLLKTAELAAGRAAPSIKSTMPQPISTDTEPEKKRLPAGVSVTKVGG